MGSEAEVVRESRPEVPPCPEMWVVQAFSGKLGWEADVVPSNRTPDEHIDRYFKHHATRTIRIPSESPATKCPHPAKQLCNVVDPGGSTERLSCGLCGSTMPSPATKRGCRWPCGCTVVCDKCDPEKAKEHACSSGSQGGGFQSSVVSDSTTSKKPSTTEAASTETPKSGTTNAPTAASGSNPPAWVLPQMLAACKPGDRLYNDLCAVFHFPARTFLSPGSDGWMPSSADEACLKVNKRECYTIPTPPPDKPKPEAKCDGSGILIDWGKPVGQRGYSCPGCPACKPKTQAKDMARAMTPDEVAAAFKHPAVSSPFRDALKSLPKPDDARDVARKVIDEYEKSTGQTVNFWGELADAITAAIRADRQKHAGTRAVVASPTPEQAKAVDAQT